MPTPIYAKLQVWEQYIPVKQKLNPAVSEVPIAWHLDHSLKVINSIYRGLVKSDPSQYKGGFHAVRMLVFLLGFFPRGRGKAPKIVLPPDDIREEDIRSQLAQAHENIAKIKALPAKAYIKHPVFGILNRDHCLRFIALHTEHHLKIIRDILAA